MKYMLLCLFALVSTCGSDDESEIPKCIQDKIQASQQDPNHRNNYISITQYRLNGELVYELVPNLIVVDVLTQVTNSDCEELCRLGGRANKKDCGKEVADFYEEAELIQVLYEKNK